MKISELLGKQESPMPHLYLDLDGVQADFFGAWSKKHGVSHWKSIQNREADIEKLANSNKKEVYDFFRDLRPLRGGAEVVRWIKKNNIPFTVLSAPLYGPYGNYCKQAKRDWLDEFNPGTSGDAIFTSNKYMYATKNGYPNVLVDDYGKYLKAWQDAGGIAIKHEDEYEDPQSGKHTIEKLEKIYRPYLNK